MLRESILYLGELGVHETILPFILIFAIMYGITQKTKIFGEENGKPKNNINAIVSFCIAYFFVSIVSYVQFTLQIIPIVVGLLLGILVVVILLGLFDIHLHKKRWTVWLFSLLFIIGIVAVFPFDLTKLLASTFAVIAIPMIVIAILFGLFFWWMFRGTNVPEKNPETSPQADKQPTPTQQPPQNGLTPEEENSLQSEIQRIRELPQTEQQAALEQFQEDNPNIRFGPPPQ